VSVHRSPPAWGSQAYFSGKLESSSVADPFFDYSGNAFQRRRIALAARFVASHVRAGGDLLDVGCATGELTAAIAGMARPSSVTAVDFVSELLEVARRRHPCIAFEHAVLPELRHPSGSFDAITCAEVLYYLAPADRAAFLAECLRVLRPGGVMVVTANSSGGSYLDRGAAGRVFGDAGFEVTATRDCYLGIASWAQRVMRALERRGGCRIPAFVEWHRAAVRSQTIVRLCEIAGRAFPPLGRSHSQWALRARAGGNAR
jgi:ubiquinone/menaquinone biosynthesis C-methylase UbiE